MTRQGLFVCKILYFNPCSEHELTHFDTTDLHDLQTGFHSIEFSEDWRLQFEKQVDKLLYRLYFYILLNQWGIHNKFTS